MQTVLALVIGVLYAAGFYLMMQRNLVSLIVGLGLLSNGVNLLIFTVAGLVRKHPPIIQPGDSLPLQPYADPLPQALILTAIVIGFGVMAFTIVLILRVYKTLKTDDLDQLRSTDAG
jgi:multicomponent Na+:H+ antiporter subunit C